MMTLRDPHAFSGSHCKRAKLARRHCRQCQVAGQGEEAVPGAVEEAGGVGRHCVQVCEGAGPAGFRHDRG